MDFITCLKEIRTTVKEFQEKNPEEVKNDILTHIVKIGVHELLTKDNEDKKERTALEQKHEKEVQKLRSKYVEKHIGKRVD